MIARSLCPRAIFWLSASALVAGCTVGIGDEPSVPLIGGVYQYSALMAADGRAVFSGTLVLEEGPHGAIGGSYRLPGQCTTPAGQTADCQGSVIGKRAADLSVSFDFDSERFHHVGTLDRDGVVRGLWTLVIVDTVTHDSTRAAGPFTGVPVR